MAFALMAWATAAVVYVAAHAEDTEFSMVWVFGLAFGFVLQRHRASRRRSATASSWDTPAT